MICYAISKAQKGYIMERQLTLNQQWVVDELKRQNCHWLSSATEREWKKGNCYYIDDRIKVKGIRRKFVQGNHETDPFTD